MENKKTGLLINIAYYGVIGLGAYLGLRYALPLLLPFIIAFLISALLHKPITVLSRRFCRIPRGAIALVVLLVFYAFFGLAFTLIFRALAVQLLEFLASLPSSLSGLAQSVMERLDQWMSRLPDWLSSALGGDNSGQLLMSAVDALSSPLMDLLGAAGSAAIRLPSAVFVLVITVIASFFITIDYEGARSLIISLCPKRARVILSGVKRRASQAAVHLLGTYGKLMLITFGELCAGFWVINLMGAGIEYVVPLSLVISLVDVLPVLGVGTVLIPWALAVLISGNTQLCLMLLGLCAVMYIVRNALESRLVGRRFGLHPALTLLALYVGGRCFGILGVFALPLILIVVMQLRSDEAFETHGENSPKTP